MKQLSFARRCNCNGKELRKTHYILGKDKWDSISQYRHDYPPKRAESTGSIMDNVTIRKTHFKLGDDVNPYQTSLMAQNEGIENVGVVCPSLNQVTKNELRKSHFKFGNFDPNFNTTFRTEYYDKSSMVPRDNLDFKEIERKLRSQNYELGNDRPDYLSETAAKYTKPNISKYDLQNQKVSTASLQQSHYVFGTAGANWNTTHRVSYTPKKADNKLYQKNLTTTNFVLGDEEPTLKSVNEETYVQHPLIVSPINDKLINDLRSHHFEFGRDEVPNQHVTHNQVTYLPPKGGYQKPTIDNQALRQTHWALGDKSQQPPDLYDTTYTRTMTPKKALPNPPVDNSTLKSSFKITGTGPTNYQTDYRASYIPKKCDMDEGQKKIINDVIKNIKNSHFDFGDMQNEFGTTMANAYQYDPNKFRGAKGQLDKELINDLRATHYKLGYQPQINQTTQRRDYIPYKNVRFVNGKNPELQKDHFKFGDLNNQKLEGITIYMADYVPKPIIHDETNDCWC